MRLVASPDGKDGSVTIHANAKVYGGGMDGKKLLGSVPGSIHPAAAAEEFLDRHLKR